MARLIKGQYKPPQIPVIMSIHGISLTSAKEIVQVFGQYYTQLYHQEPVPGQLMLAALGPDGIMADLYNILQQDLALLLGLYNDMWKGAHISHLEMRHL